MSSAKRRLSGHTLLQHVAQQEDYLPDWANSFLIAKRVEGVSPHTLAFYKQQLGHFLTFCEAQLIERVSQITPDTIREFLLWHESTGHNKGGLHCAYRVLRTFLLWFENEVEPEGWRNPIRKVRPPKVSLEPLEEAELSVLQAMLDTCQGGGFLDMRDKALLLVMLDTGLRARELLSLDVEDIDLVAGEIVLRRGKGQKFRLAFLGRSARKALRVYLNHRKDGNPALWVTIHGERLQYHGLRKVLMRRARMAGVKAPTAHAIRRAFALNCLRAGVDLQSVARLLGHSNLMTVSRYLRQVPDDLRQAHAKAGVADRLKGR